MSIIKRILEFKRSEDIRGINRSAYYFYSDSDIGDIIDMADKHGGILHGLDKNWDKEILIEEIDAGNKILGFTLVHDSKRHWSVYRPTLY